MIDGDNAPYATHWRKIWQSIIQYPGQARDLASRIFTESVKESGGVRFFKKYEQIQQITLQGPEKIMRDIVTVCARNKWSDSSSKKLLAMFGGESKKGELAMATVELAAMTDIGRILCTACYMAEGDVPLILTLHIIIKRVEDMLERGGYDVTTLEGIVDRCVEMFNEALLPLEMAVIQSDNGVQDTENEVLQANNVVVNFKNDKHEITHTTTNGRSRKKATALIDGDALERIERQIDDADATVASLQVILAERKTIVAEAKRKVSKWKLTFPRRTRHELIDYGKTIGKPSCDYYKNNFKMKEVI
jgi:hypothetical protein